MFAMTRDRLILTDFSFLDELLLYTQCSISSRGKSCRNASSLWGWTNCQPIEKSWKKRTQSACNISGSRELSPVRSDFPGHWHKMILVQACFNKQKYIIIVYVACIKNSNQSWHCYEPTVPKQGFQVWIKTDVGERKNNNRITEQ